MWISQATFERLLKESAEARGVAHALERQNIALHATLDWMKLRVTQVEHERAQLLFNYTGVKVAVPSIEETPHRPAGPDILAAALDFNDVGDAEAARLGVSWDEHGEIKYTTPTT